MALRCARWQYTEPRQDGPTCTNKVRGDVHPTDARERASVEGNNTPIKRVNMAMHAKGKEPKVSNKRLSLTLTMMPM